VKSEGEFGFKDAPSASAVFYQRTATDIRRAKSKTATKRPASSARRQASARVDACRGGSNFLLAFTAFDVS
jgi:hypothetical protein